MWRAAISVGLAVCSGACLGWSIVAVITHGRVVAAVACMSASMVGSFGMLICHLARPGPVTRRIEIAAKDARSPRTRNVVVSETSVVCVAVECLSPSSPGLMMWVFEPSAESARVETKCS